MFIIDHKINKCLYGIRDHLTSEVLTHLQSYGNKITQNKRDLVKKAVSCFLLNAYPKYLVKQNSVPITLYANNYSKPVIVNGKSTNRKVSYRYMRILLDFLEFEDYCTLEKGRVIEYTYRRGYGEALKSDSSKVRFNQKMLELFSDYVTNWKPEKLSNVLKMRNGKKEEVTFTMDDLQKEKKDYLQDFNKFSMGKVVRLDDVVYDVQMYKIYNDSSFYKGARSYMKNSIQGLSKQDRHRLVIDDEKVCAFDYKGFEPSLTYSMEQEIMECEDPYEIDLPNYDYGTLRGLCKLGLIIMLNVKSRGEATDAFNYAIAKDYNLDKLYSSDKIPSKFIPTKVIMQLLEEKHHLIAHRFFKGYGLEVQYVGSLINDYVVSSMMQNHEQLVLQVFDEFICQEDYAYELEKTMIQAYEYVFGFSDNCNIVREK